MLLAVYTYLLIQLIYVAYIDLKTRKIHNMWTLMNIGIFISLCLLFPKMYTFQVETFFYTVAFIIVGFGLFCFKLMGGGDSKYLASIYLLIPIPVQDTAFTTLLYSTVAIGIYLLINNTLKNFDKLIEMVKLRKFDIIKRIYGAKFSYAPVILLSWIWFGFMVKVWRN